MNSATALIWTTPPLVFIAINISSSMLRVWLARRRAEECDAMTGARDRPIACRIAAFDGCDTSTIMPSRFISRITCLPKSFRPRVFPISSPEDPAQLVLTLQAPDMYRTPIW